MEELLNIWKLNNTLLDNSRAKEEITKEIRSYFARNENEITAYQNLWDAAAAVLKRLCIAFDT